MGDEAINEAFPWRSSDFRLVGLCGDVEVEFISEIGEVGHEVVRLMELGNSGGVVPSHGKK